VSDSPASGAYQVNSNCSMVTQRVLPTGATLEERWVITDRGNELRSIVASPASTMVSAVAQRIDRR
jgi:hypothetical protein